MLTYRSLAPSQRSSVRLGGPGLTEPALLFEISDMLVEAPNWTLDGAALVVNGAGRLWMLQVDQPDRGLVEVPFVGLPEINNDHVLDPDGEHVFLSANDRHIYRGSLRGGVVERVTPEDGRWHFLHGVSPDGTRLAYVELERIGGEGRLVILPARGGEPRVVPTGVGHLDGPEWAPDGRTIVFNTEHFSARDGHAQLARIADGGGAVERLLASDTVDWFPHISPDGLWASYLQFPAGTKGHPADRNVVVMVVSTQDWSKSIVSYPLFGGQGTLNVNSWSPDCDRFAFVAYPVGR